MLSGSQDLCLVSQRDRAGPATVSTRHCGPVLPALGQSPLLRTDRWSRRTRRPRLFAFLSGRRERPPASGHRARVGNRRVEHAPGQPLSPVRRLDDETDDAPDGQVVDVRDRVRPHQAAHVRARAERAPARRSPVEVANHPRRVWTLAHLQETVGTISALEGVVLRGVDAVGEAPARRCIRHLRPECSL